MAIQIAGNQIKSGAVDTTQIADNSIDANKLDLSQNYTFSGNVAGITPTANGHFTTKQYVDGIVGNGVFWKEPCEVATTGNINLSNPATSTFDNVTISSGQRVLVRAQSDASQNGLYDFNGASSAMTRSADADSASELQTAAVFVNRGDTYSDQAFVETQSITTLGSDDVEFVRFSGLGMVSAGTALSKQGDTLNVQVDDVAIEVNGSDQLQLKDLGIVDGKIANSTISAGKLAGSIPDSKLNQITSAAKVAGSAVQLAASGGLENASGLAIEDDGIVQAMISDNAVSSAKINFEPTRETLSTNGNSTAFNLSNSLPDNFDDVLVFRNGLLAERVASNPADEDQYTSSISGGTCTVTFGSAPASSDKVIVAYFQIKS